MKYLLILIFSLLLFSCNTSENEPSPNTNEPTLEGYWEIESLELNEIIYSDCETFLDDNSEYEDYKDFTLININVTSDEITVYNNCADGSESIEEWIYFYEFDTDNQAVSLFSDSVTDQNKYLEYEIASLTEERLILEIVFVKESSVNASLWGVKDAVLTLNR